MKELRRMVTLIVTIVLIVGVADGDIDRLTNAVTQFLSRLAEDLRLIAVALALPAFLAGAVFYASPWHRNLGARMIAGALTVLTAAVLGPPIVSWFDIQLTTWGARVLGGAP